MNWIELNLDCVYVVIIVIINRITFLLCDDLIDCIWKNIQRNYFVIETVVEFSRVFFFQRQMDWILSPNTNYLSCLFADGVSPVYDVTWRACDRNQNKRHVASVTRHFWSKLSKANSNINMWDRNYTQISKFLSSHHEAVSGLDRLQNQGAHCVKYLYLTEINLTSVRV